jgi:hypothetical protein
LALQPVKECTNRLSDHFHCQNLSLRPLLSHPHHAIRPTSVPSQICVSHLQAMTRRQSKRAPSRRCDSFAPARDGGQTVQIRAVHAPSGIGANCGRTQWASRHSSLLLQRQRDGQNGQGIARVAGPPEMRTEWCTRFLQTSATLAFAMEGCFATRGRDQCTNPSIITLPLSIALPKDPQI